MLIYEVNITVSPDIQEEYRSWIEPHVQEVIAHKGFTKADIFERLSPEGDPQYVMHYWIESQEALEAYLRDHAPRLRQEAFDRFGSKFKGERRVLKEKKKIFKNSEK